VPWSKNLITTWVKSFDYLKNTEDPRWPGHKLIEEYIYHFHFGQRRYGRSSGEVITDNYPLDKGKISAMEGGTRVPLIITGPGIPKGIESDVMVNGLDFLSHPPLKVLFEWVDINWFVITTTDITRITLSKKCINSTAQ